MVNVYIVSALIADYTFDYIIHCVLYIIILLSLYANIEHVLCIISKLL